MKVSSLSLALYRETRQGPAPHLATLCPLKLLNHLVNLYDALLLLLQLAFQHLDPLDQSFVCSALLVPIIIVIFHAKIKFKE